MKTLSIFWAGGSVACRNSNIILLLPSKEPAFDLMEFAKQLWGKVKKSNFSCLPFFLLLFSNYIFGEYVV